MNVNVYPTDNCGRILGQIYDRSVSFIYHNSIPTFSANRLLQKWFFWLQNDTKNSTLGSAVFHTIILYRVTRKSCYSLFEYIFSWQCNCRCEYHFPFFQFTISEESFLSRSTRIALHSAGNFLAAEKLIFTSISAPTGSAFFSTLSGNTKCVPCR